MRTAETTAEIRSLTDAELDQVNGGWADVIIAGAVLVAACAVVGIGFDILPGELEDAKKATGWDKTDSLKPLPT